MKFLIRSLLLLASIGHSHEPTTSVSKGTGLKVLVYSNTGYYRHPETPKINRWLVLLGHENGFEVDVTEHWKDMRAEELSGYDVLVLNNANELDKVLPEEQRKSVEEWFTKGGKGIVGLHAALLNGVLARCADARARRLALAPPVAAPSPSSSPPSCLRRWLRFWQIPSP